MLFIYEDQKNIFFSIYFPSLFQKIYIHKLKNDDTYIRPYKQHNNRSIEVGSFKKRRKILFFRFRMKENNFFLFFGTTTTTTLIIECFKWVWWVYGRERESKEWEGRKRKILFFVILLLIVVVVDVVLLFVFIYIYISGFVHSSLFHFRF